MTLNSFAAIALIVLVAFGTLVTCSMVGKPRKPTDGSTAVITVILNTLVILAVLRLWAK